MKDTTDLDIFKSRADVRLRASLQKPKLDVLPPPTDEEEWRRMERAVRDSKDPVDAEYWRNRLEHELFYRSQWRAINMEERRREEFRKLVDKTEGDCFEVWKRVLGNAKDLKEWLEQTRAVMDPGGLSAGKRIVLQNRLERAANWVKELKEMMK